MTGAVVDTWDPAQYRRFQTERDAPFLDLLSLVEATEGPRVADLGCGDGRMTAVAHHRLGATLTLGIDSSPAMLSQAPTVPGISFELGDIASWEMPAGIDVVLANASLQWAPDHAGVLRRWVGSLAAGGQLAVQVPVNADHPSQAVAAEVAEELSIDAGPDPLALHPLTAEAYAAVLDDLGAVRQHVRLQVYVHHLSSSTDIVEWMKGSTLTRIQRAVDDETYRRFLDRYRERLVAAIGERAPYTFLFKRIHLWARF